MARPKKESTREMISFRLPLDLWSWVMSRSDRTEMLERLVRAERDRENAKRFPELWKLWQEEHLEDLNADSKL